MLTNLSPGWLPLEGGREFYLTSGHFGDGGQAKDAIQTDFFANLCPDGAVIVNAETSKRTGLIGSQEKKPDTGGWVIRLGKLPEGDRCAAYLSGIGSYDSKAWSQLREVLSTRRAEITGARRACYEVRSSGLGPAVPPLSPLLLETRR